MLEEEGLQMPGEKSERGVLVEGAVLAEVRRTRGYRSRAALADALGDISIDTLDRWEKSPSPPWRANPNLLNSVADFLEVQVEALIHREGPIPPRERSCAGNWRARGDDIIVPGHFEYPAGVKFVEAEVSVRVMGETVIAEGLDHDRDFLSFFGYTREGGNFIVGTYTVANEKLHAYGTVILHFASCGDRMTGFYVGRDTGQGSMFILGNMTMERIK